MRFLTIAALALIVPAAGLAAERKTDEQKLEKMLEGMVPGKPVDCIRQGPNVDSTTFDGVIVYRDGGTRYVNRFGDGCRFLRNEDALVIRLYSGQLCRGDIANVIDPAAHIPRGSCVFGDFTPYKKPK